MKDKINEYYELITDKDLQSNESYDEMILKCPRCGALFGEKACGNRTIFPWCGFHPTNGNCKVLTHSFTLKLERMTDNCDYGGVLERITTVKELTKAIKDIK